jgi:hypothetical protein
MSTVFSINLPSISLKILINEVEKLHIHEQVMPEITKKLVKQIKTDNHILHPIIVDEKSLVVLDGMHRLAAVQKIGYKFIPVCLVDYYSSYITISSWYRLIDNLKDIHEISNVLREFNFELESTSWEKAYDLVEKRKAYTAIFSRDKNITLYGTKKDIKEIYDVIKQLEVTLKSKGFSIGYDTEERAKEKVYSGKISAAIMTPKISKEEVINTAQAGKVFTQKATRHIIPARPMFINVPNEWLSGNMSLSEANQRLVEHLSSKKIKRLPPGQVLDRLYDEELYTFT